MRGARVLYCELDEVDGMSCVEGFSWLERAQGMSLRADQKQNPNLSSGLVC
jgi:hypothetical protein